MTCHTCLSCLTYRSLKCKFDKSIALLMLELPLTCHCHDVLCGNLPYEHIGHTMPPLGISFFSNCVTCPLFPFTHFILSVREGQKHVPGLIIH